MTEYLSFLDLLSTAEVVDNDEVKRRRRFHPSQKTDNVNNKERMNSFEMMCDVIFRFFCKVDKQTKALKFGHPSLFSFYSTFVMVSCVVD